MTTLDKIFDAIFQYADENRPKTKKNCLNFCLLVCANFVTDDFYMADKQNIYFILMST